MKVELLAPGGSYETILAAYQAGADAVYTAGERFGARAYADNLNTEQLVELINYAHIHGRKLYLTVNTLLKNQELESLYDYLLPYYEAGLDAVLIQDLGVLRYVHEQFPDLPIHASTQMTVTGSYSAQMLKKYGVTRIVTPRELSLAETADLYRQTGMEIESFIHGALCYCYSGQCLMSSLIGGRSGNRGRCAQTCRLPFTVSDQKGNHLNPRKEQNPISLKDLNSLAILPQILDAGVFSLKIEGRMKRAEYTAGVVSIYRKYLDYLLQNRKENMRYSDISYRVSKEDQNTLMQLFNRNGFTDGYWKAHNGREMLTLTERQEIGERKDLMDAEHARYVGKTLKKPVSMRVSLHIGSPAILTLMTDAEEGEPYEILVVSEEIVQEAAKQPMDREAVRTRLAKLGGTNYTCPESAIEVDMDANIFLSVRTLNSLRQQAVAELEERILDSYRRTAGPRIPWNGTENGQLATGSGDPSAQSASAGPAASKDQQAGSRQMLTLRINHRHQLTAVADRMFRQTAEEGDGSLRGISRIYINDRVFLSGTKEARAEALGIVRKLKDRGIDIYWELPYIFRAEAVLVYEHIADAQLMEDCWTGFLVHSAEELAYLRKRLEGCQADRKLISDASLYVMNASGYQWAKEQGIDEITFPFELNAGELKNMHVRGEMIVYGRIPLMLSAQCVESLFGPCHKGSYDREDGTVTAYLTDRKGMHMPVERNCKYCYTVIYNANVLNLAGETASMQTFADTYRIQLTDEDGRQAVEVLEGVRNMLDGRQADLPDGNAFTKGHYRRGVE